MVGSRRRVGSLALLFLILGSAVTLVAEAYGQGDGSVPVVGESYQPGPLGSRAQDGAVSLPDGAEELLGLSVLVAFLYGFRASGLAKSSGGRARVPRP